LLDWGGLYKYLGAMVQSTGNSAGLHSPVQDGVDYPKHFIFSFTKHPSAGWEEKKDFFKKSMPYSRCCMILIFLSLLFSLTINHIILSPFGLLKLQLC